MKTKISDDEAKAICKLGQGNKCCAYLILGGDGFECAKDFPPIQSIIESRLEKGDIHAQGKGDWLECLYKVVRG